MALKVNWTFFIKELDSGLGLDSEGVKWTFTLGMDSYSRMVSQLLIGFLFIVIVRDFCESAVGGFSAVQHYEVSSSLYFRSKAPRSTHWFDSLTLLIC